MGILSFFLKPAWQSKDSVVRAGAIAADHTDALREALPGIALHDPVAAVRQAALQRLDDLSLYVARATQDDDAGCRAFARKHALAAIGGALEPAPERVLGMLKSATASEIETIAERAKSPDLRRAALALIDKQGYLGDRALADRAADIRLWLGTRLTQRATMERVAEQARKVDKQLYRALKARLETLDSAQSAAVRLRQAEAICIELEALVRAIPRDSAARLTALRAQFAAFTDLPQSLTDRFAGGAAMVEQVLTGAAAGPQSAEGFTAEALADHAETSPAERDTVLLALRERAATLDLRDRKAWATLQQELYARLADVPSDPAHRDDKAAIESRLAEHRAALKQDDDARLAAHAVWRNQLDALRVGVEAGNLGKARPLLTQVEQFAVAHPSSLSASESRQLADLRAQIDKLVAWERWSNNQVRATLCDEIEAIPGSGLHPDAVASKVKAAQAKFAELDALEQLSAEAAKKHGLSRRFRAVCFAAMKPTQAYFEKRKEIRGERAVAIDAWLSDTERGVADPATPIKSLHEWRREARECLHRLDEIDPAQRGDSSRRLKGLLDSIGPIIDQRSQDAEANKRKVLAKLRRDISGKAREVALGLAKTAQREFQSLGSAGRKLDQTLWEELRALVDPLFADAKAEVDAQRAQSDAQSSAARALLTAATALRDQASEHGADSTKARLVELEQQWQALAIEDSRLERDFDRLREAVRSAAAAQSARSRQQAQAAVLDVAALLHAAESDPTQADAVRVQVASWTDKSLQEIVRRRLDEHSTIDSAAAELSASRLAIAFEHLAGVSSPDSARAARMDYQVQLLAAKLGQGEIASADGLLREWLALRGVPASVWPGLHARVAKAYAALI